MSELAIYGPETPSLLKPGAPITCSAKPGREDNIVALALRTRTPLDPKSEVKGSLYSVKVVATGYLEGR